LPKSLNRQPTEVNQRAIAIARNEVQSLAAIGYRLAELFISPIGFCRIFRPRLKSETNCNDYRVEAGTLALSTVKLEERPSAFRAVSDPKDFTGARVNMKILQSEKHSKALA